MTSDFNKDWAVKHIEAALELVPENESIRDALESLRLEDGELGKADIIENLEWIIDQQKEVIQFALNALESDSMSGGRAKAIHLCQQSLLNNL